MFIPIEPERKDGLIDQALSDHVLKHGDHTLDGNIRIRHAQNAIETASYECYSRFVNCLGKRLVNHFNTSHTQNICR